MRFSQRLGITSAIKVAQKDSIDVDLRNALWNALDQTVWDSFRGTRVPGKYGSFIRGSNLEPLIKIIWADHLKLPLDTMPPTWAPCLSEFRTRYFNAQWYEVYDFVEIVAKNSSEHTRNSLSVLCNEYLERENAAYRFVDGKIAEITSTQEIAEIEAAIERSAPYAGVKTHFERALTLMTDRENPDFRNSIKESISAVESLAKQIAENEKGTLGEILTYLEKAKGLHPALKKAFSSLYGYTNDANGIRHALLEEHDLTKADARFMLICCSAFVNYVIDVVSVQQ